MVEPNTRRASDYTNNSVSSPSSTTSEDAALAEMLGISSIAPLSLNEESAPSTISVVEELPSCVLNDLRQEYQSKGIVRLDLECLRHFFPSASSLRRWTEECAYENDLKKDSILRTFETTAAGVRKLTRLEHFVHSHEGWNSFFSSGSPLSCLVGLVCSPSSSSSPPYPLYKEKLNLKPPLGSGFAPHLDAPSLRVVGLSSDFVTVMVAIDDMTVANGCLRVVEGDWNEDNAVECEKVNGDNPDGDGRRGAIPPAISETLEWESVICKGGSVYVFNGWIPHRSAANNTSFSRRAIFLTYNSPEDGELRDVYYDRMKAMREEFKRKQKFESASAFDDNEEKNWLKSIPS